MPERSARGFVPHVLGLELRHATNQRTSCPSLHRLPSLSELGLKTIRQAGVVVYTNAAYNKEVYVL